MISSHLEAVSSQHLGGAASILLSGLQYSLLLHASWTQHRHDYHSGLKAFSQIDQVQQWVSESRATYQLLWLSDIPERDPINNSVHLRT